MANMGLTQELANPPPPLLSTDTETPSGMEKGCGRLKLAVGLEPHTPERGEGGACGLGKIKQRSF